MAAGKTNKIISRIILCLLIAFGFYYLKTYAPPAILLKKEALKYLFIISLLVVCALYLRALLTKIYMDYFGLTLNIHEWLGINSLSTLVNFLPIQGGIISKALYLKNRYKFPYAKFISYVAAINIITLFTIGIIGTGMLASLRYKQTSSSNIFFLIFFITTILPLLIFFLPMKTMPENTKNKFMSFMQTAIKQLYALKKSKGTLLKLIAIQAALFLVLSLNLFVIFKLLLLDVSLSTCIIITLLSSMALFIPLLPGGLGIKETIAGAGAVAFDITFVNGAGASAIERFIIIAWSFAIGLFFYNIYIRCGK